MSDEAICPICGTNALHRLVEPVATSGTVALTLKLRPWKASEEGVRIGSPLVSTSPPIVLWFRSDSLPLINFVLQLSLPRFVRSRCKLTFKLRYSPSYKFRAS